MGKLNGEGLKVGFNGRLRLEFHGSSREKRKPGSKIEKAGLDNFY